MKRRGGVLALEDVLWAGWLAVLRPASGELFLEGGATSVFLLAASTGFWVAALVGVRGQARRPGTVMLMSLGMCSLLIDAALRQAGAPMFVRQVHTAAVIVLGIAAAWQHRATGGRTWLHAPAWVRRALSWPILMVLADMFSGIMGALVEPRTWGDAPAGETIFQAVFFFGVVMPVIYIFFVVAPRLTIRPEEDASHATWALRFLWALATALVGTLVVEPLLSG